MSYQEQRDYETIEDDIAVLEDSLKDLDRQIADNACDFPKLSKLTEKREETQKKLDEETDRWVYLEELQEKIAEQQST